MTSWLGCNCQSWTSTNGTKYKGVGRRSTQASARQHGSGSVVKNLRPYQLQSGPEPNGDGDAPAGSPSIRRSLHRRPRLTDRVVSDWCNRRPALTAFSFCCVTVIYIDRTIAVFMHTSAKFSTMRSDLMSNYHAKCLRGLSL